jgi:selenium-binding protein 1
MPSLRPDPTFYPSPGMAMQAPPERLAYVTMLNVGANGQPDGMGVVDLDPASATYGQLVGGVDFPNGDNELHHFGWNACSACLCPQSPHPHMNAATWWSRGSPRPGFTSWTRSPTRSTQSW